jgi:hypothetical protein
MGMIAYYHMLVNREANVTSGSAEDSWLKGQMANCVTFLQNAQAAEAAYEKANPGQTYLAQSFCDILNQSTTKMDTAADFNKWWIDNLISLDGTGQSFMDWFQPMIVAEQDPSAGGASQSDLLGVAFASTMMFSDLDNTSLGQMGGVDAYFSNKDWTHPFQASLFPTLAPEMITFFLWSQDGSPNPGGSGWSDFTQNLGYMGNLLNPSNLPTPGPSNYDTYVWPAFSSYESTFDNGQFPNGDTLSSALSNFWTAFDDKFIN